MNNLNLLLVAPFAVFIYLSVVYCIADMHVEKTGEFADGKSLSASRGVGPELEAVSGDFHAQTLPERALRVNNPPFCGPARGGLKMQAAKMHLSAARVFSCPRTPVRCRSRGNRSSRHGSMTGSEGSGGSRAASTRTPVSQTFLMSARHFFDGILRGLNAERSMTSPSGASATSASARLSRCPRILVEYHP